MQDITIEQDIRRKAKRRNTITALMPFLGLVFVIALFSVLTGGKLLKGSNLSNMIDQSATVMLVASGAAFVYACGGMDMSLGSAAGVIQLIAVLLLQKISGIPTFFTLIIMMLLGMIITGISGTIYTKLGVPAFVATLCVKYICSGILATATSAGNFYANYAYFSFFNTTAARAGVLVIVMIVTYILFEYTKIGKHAKAIGGNSHMARQSGVNVDKITIIAFMIMGATLGIASFQQLGRINQVSASSGSGIEMNVLVAIVLGGFPLTGGTSSRMRCALIGSITVTILTNGLTLMGVDTGIIGGVKGILFLIIVGVSYVRTNPKFIK